MSKPMAKRRRFDGMKRIVDLALGSAIFACSLPVQAVVAIAVRVNLGSPIIFSQSRPGLHGEIFKIYKFRSMLNVSLEDDVITNEQRITPFGRALRSTSLDELPSLINVIKGDMSLVGPRPLRVEYLERYSARQARRHEVRPGLTGLAQVNGRNSLSWDQRLEMDVRYVERRSPWLDLRILFNTVRKVLIRDGVVEEGQASMSAFLGTAGDFGLVEHQLSHHHVEERVRWLTDERIRSGITIDFVPTVESTLEWLKKIGNIDKRRDWVYCDEAGQPVAMCGLDGVGSQNASLYIYVNPDLHGRGFGKIAMSTLIQRARSFGIMRLELETKSANIAAQRLYTSLGFMESCQEVECAEEKVSMFLKLDRVNGA